MPPSISVVMPVYNAGTFLKESIDSILQQSFEDFEFFIIDDASTDNSAELIRSFTDKRIRFIEKPANTGYTDSLNMAIQLSKGKYIARMDADDISEQQRFLQQFQYMENNPAVLVLGTAYKIIGTDEMVQLPLSYEEAKVVSIMHVPVAHPTVMMRKEIFTRYQFLYNKKYEPAEDYDLWTKVLEIGKIENLQKPLLYYRRHSAQQSILRYETLLQAAVEIRLRQLNKLIIFTGKSYDVLFAIATLSKQAVLVNGDSMQKLVLLLSDMMNANILKKVYDTTLLNSYLRERWLFHLLKFAKPAVKDIRLLRTMQRSAVTRMSPLFCLNYLVKCIWF